MVLLAVSDQEKAEKELNCYHYCIDNAFDFFERGEYGKAAIYYENAVRSLRELDKINQNQINRLKKGMNELG